ncbi:MAG TPA: response regulator [Thermoanaerobaculia bacterium]
MSRSDPPTLNSAVLVVDDDQALRGLFTTLLGKNGFAVDTAADGRIAFDQIHLHNYSVILLDLMMPDVNGFELLDWLERDSPSLLQKVIVMTRASQRAIQNLDTSRVWGLIRKPFDIDNLVSSTLACAEGKRSSH